MPNRIETVEKELGDRYICRCSDGAYILTDSRFPKSRGEKRITVDQFIKDLEANKPKGFNIALWNFIESVPLLDKIRIKANKIELGESK